MWCRDMVSLLCMRDSIVELVPSIQQFPGGGTHEVMTTRPRSDLYMNLPALKKLDVMLVSIFVGFQDTEKWLPCPKVPPKGLSEDARKKLQQCRDYVNQMLKAALEINSSVLTEMDIPNAYLETLPKCDRPKIAVAFSFGNKITCGELMRG
ncbi:rho guanyl-nucleotide exchange factor 1 [Actinidia rufa]|uniref:Rho guanyl-nucleotide exchange factor 1 n=1 Tax=Actinidia rufa TaxID=165716 RepID=A0A7J0GUV0_9ERIC|nr:rho guanyl-nucleotide exchange factor 1 [Actinidia rufa]